MTPEMTAKVLERVNEMKNDINIQKRMLQFATDDEAIEWLIKAAVATLVIAPSDRK